MSVTHIRARTGVAYCGAVPSGPWESISLPHWQLARQAPDWMGLQAHPTPLCEPCRLETALLPPQPWPSLGATGARPSARCDRLPCWWCLGRLPGRCLLCDRGRQGAA